VIPSPDRQPLNGEESRISDKIFLAAKERTERKRESFLCALCVLLRLFIWLRLRLRYALCAFSWPTHIRRFAAQSNKTFPNIFVKWALFPVNRKKIACGEDQSNMNMKTKPTVLAAEARDPGAMTPGLSSNST